MCRCSPASTFGAPPLTPSAGFVLGPGEELEGGRVGTVPGGARPLPTCWRVGGSCGALALCGRAAGWLAQAVCPEPASARLSPSGMAHVLLVCGQAPVCSGEPCSGPRSLPGTASGNPAAGRHMRCRNPQVRQGGPGAGAQPAGDPPPPPCISLLVLAQPVSREPSRELAASLQPEPVPTAPASSSCSVLLSVRPAVRAPETVACDFRPRQGFSEWQVGLVSPEL